MRKWMVLAILVAIAFIAVPALAATPEQIEASVVKGLDWLAANQNDDGSWGTSNQVAYTGLAVLKMEGRALELSMDPLDPSYEYSTNVQDGLDYLTSQVKGDGSIWGDTNHRNYETAVATMAFSESNHPELYLTTVQNAVTYLEAGQMFLGGWGYDPGLQPPGGPRGGPQDNSNSGYVTLALVYAEAFGATVQPGTKDPGLKNWVNVIQDTSATPNNGGSWYRAPGDNPWPWVNVLKTGNLLYEQKVVGYGTGDTRVQAAVAYIGRHWYDLMDPEPGYNQPWLRTPPNYQAMYCLMKGFTAQGITTIDGLNWYDDLAQIIVDNQFDDGYWEDSAWGERVGDTAWALLTLEKTVVIPVSFKVRKSASTNSVHGNEPVTYEYEVENTGIVNIHPPIVLTDDPFGVIAGPPYDGDDGDGILEPNEIWKYHFTTTLTAMTTDKAYACGWDERSDPPEQVCTDWSNQVTVIYVNSAPDPEPAYPSIENGCLWPPNHQSEPVSVLGVIDPDGDPVTITFNSIWSDEPTATALGAGGADKWPDATISPDSLTATLRAERAGTPKQPGNGRVYNISFTASDGFGGVSTGFVEVCVPHDQKIKPCFCEDEGRLYDATVENVV